MSTNLTNHETLEPGLEEPDEETLNAYLRAHGVTPATRRWEPRPGIPVKQRPWWLAFIFRTLRRLRIYDD